MDREPPRWKTRPWRGHESYACTRCDYATTDRGEIAKHARTRHPLRREAPPPGPLASVDFASDEAAEAAARAGLTADQLTRLPASGKGGYTVADVRTAARLTATAKE